MLVCNPIPPLAPSGDHAKQPSRRLAQVRRVGSGHVCLFTSTGKHLTIRPAKRKRRTNSLPGKWAAKSLSLRVASSGPVAGAGLPGGPMKNAAFFAAALLAAVAGPSFAKNLRIPITRINSVPVKCAAEPLGTCHNRWHPGIDPVMEANPGDIVTFETRDAFDNPFNRDTT